MIFEKKSKQERDNQENKNQSGQTNEVSHRAVV